MKRIAALALNLTACATVPPDASLGSPAYRAIGTEPFWDLTIEGGGVMVFTDRGNGVSVIEPTPPVRIEAGGEIFAGKRLRVSVSRANCSDGMSDRVYPDTVSVLVDGRPYRGCGAPIAFFTAGPRI